MSINNRPQILKLHGVDWDMFKDEKDAVKAADELIAQNRALHTDLPHDKDIHSTVAPALLTKFVYRQDEGSIVSLWDIV